MTVKAMTNPKRENFFVSLREKPDWGMWVRATSRQSAALYAAEQMSGEEWSQKIEWPLGFLVTSPGGRKSIITVERELSFQYSVSDSVWTDPETEVEK